MSTPNEIQALAHKLEESKRRIELIRTMTAELNRISNLPDKLNTILRLLHDQFGILYSQMLLPDKTGKTLTVKASYGYHGRELQYNVFVGTGIPGLAAAHKKPINITGLRRKRFYLRVIDTDLLSPDAGTAGLANPESQIAIPLISNEELVAVLLAESENVSVFSKDDEAFLITLSQSIAVSIQNSLLFDSMEEIIAKRTDELRKTNETKDRLFSLISHDLRGPITSFHNISKLVSHYNRRGEKEKIETLSGRIDGSVNKLNALLDNLLNWSLTQTGEISCHIEKIPVEKLLEEVTGLYHEAILSKEIELFTSPAAFFVQGDYNMLSAVFRNLISNAIKYTPRLGSVSILVTQQEDTVTIQIKDTGIGISASRLPTLFEPAENRSTQGTEYEKGTGLGLLVAKEFVQLNKGTITLHSRENEGTTITVSLPAAIA